MFNTVIVTGRLTAAPELKKTTSDLSVCSFQIANETGYGENKKTHFLPVVAWRGTAEFVCKYFAKGQMIGIIGSMQSRQYETKDGQKRTAYEIVANEVQFAEPKRETGRLVGADEFIAEQEAAGRMFSDAEYAAAKEDVKPAKRGYDALVDDDDAALPF